MTNLRISYDEFTIINMLIFERSYDDFMILIDDRVWLQISSHKIYLFKLWLRHSLRMFLCFYAVKMFYFVELLQLTIVHNINNGFSALVIGCYFYLRS